MTYTLDHLKALHIRLSHERERRNKSRTEIEWQAREVTVSGVQKEIRGEVAFLEERGVTVPGDLDPFDHSGTVSDSDLLDALGAECTR